MICFLKLQIKIRLSGDGGAECPERNIFYNIQILNLLEPLPVTSEINKINKNHNPIIHSISANFVQFCKQFWATEGNLKKSKLLYNLNFTSHEGNHLSEAFFSPQTWAQNSHLLIKITLAELIDASNKPFDFQFTRSTLNLNWTYFEYLRTKSCLEKAIRANVKHLNNKSLDLGDFLKRPNLKAKNFRKYISPQNLTLKQCTPVKTRYAWADLDIDILREKRFYSMWVIHFLPINIKEFASKLLNNKLSFNANLAHSENISPACFFCLNASVLPAPKETASHFFLHCPIVSDILSKYFQQFLINKNITWDNKFCIIGCPPEIKFEFASIINIEIITICHYIFKVKCSKKNLLFKNLSEYMTWMRSILTWNRKYSLWWEGWQKILP